MRGLSTPYFRTDTFSNILRDNEKMMLDLLHAPEKSKCVFLTASGTGAMESCVMNVLNEADNVLVVNGGSFGQRFVELCNLHQRKITEISVSYGAQLKKEQLYLYSNQGYSALLVNMHETSSGLLYDMELIAEFCRANNILFIIDAISAFIADELDMSLLNADVVITSSQKALAVQPGISILALSERAIKRINENEERCMYLSLKEALKNAERGQTPWTPAVTILLQIHARLTNIYQQGGIGAEQAKIKALAEEFRTKIKGLPFDIVAESTSNAVTALHPLSAKASDIVRILDTEFNIWVCPNGGALKDEVFRVGHIGYISAEDNQKLIDALWDMNRRGLL